MILQLKSPYRYLSLYSEFLNLKYLNGYIRRCETQKTRQRLIEVTAHAMAQYGEAGVRVDRIAAESGINKRMIYHYFGDKEGVCATVLALQILALSSILHEPQMPCLERNWHRCCPWRVDVSTN